MYIDNKSTKFSEKQFSTKDKEYKTSNEVNFNSSPMNFDESVNISGNDKTVETSNGIEDDK